MLKCYECGSVFNHNEVLEFIEPHGEVHTVCPFCKGGYEDAHKCTCCEKVFGKSELMEGLCEECIKDAITAQNVKKYLEETGCFADFMIRYYYGFDTIVGSLNETDEKELDFKELFNEKATLKNLKKLFEQYVYEDIEDFAEWVSNKRKGVL